MSDQPRAALDAAQRMALDELLVAQRHRAEVRIAALTREFDAVVESVASAPPDDEHDPEGATIAFERTQIATLLANDRAQLVELDRARQQLRDGTGGTCERCGDPIALERLLARPTARTCVACAHAAR